MDRLMFVFRESAAWDSFSAFLRLITVSASSLSDRRFMIYPPINQLLTASALSSDIVFMLSARHGKIKRPAFSSRVKFATKGTFDAGSIICFHVFVANSNKNVSKTVSGA